MRFVVDLTQCDNHGQCARYAPDSFALDDSGALAFRSSGLTLYTSEVIRNSEVGAVEEAAEMCPTQAIELIDP